MIYSFIHGEGLMRFIIVMYAPGMDCLGRDYLRGNHALAAPEEQEEQKVRTTFRCCSLVPFEPPELNSLR